MAREMAIQSFLSAAFKDETKDEDTVQPGQFRDPATLFNKKT